MDGPARSGRDVRFCERLWRAAGRGEIRPARIMVWLVHAATRMAASASARRQPQRLTTRVSRSTGFCQTRLFPQMALGGRGILSQHSRGSDWTRNEIAAAIGTGSAKHLVRAGCAERTLERADHRLAAFRRKSLVTTFAIRLELHHLASPLRSRPRYAAIRSDARQPREAECLLPESF